MVLVGGNEFGRLNGKKVFQNDYLKFCGKVQTGVLIINGLVHFEYIKWIQTNG